jgi:hypothetical protein
MTCDSTCPLCHGEGCVSRRCYTCDGTGHNELTHYRCIVCCGKGEIWIPCWREEVKRKEYVYDEERTT